MSMRTGIHRGVIALAVLATSTAGRGRRPEPARMPSGRRGAARRPCRSRRRRRLLDVVRVGPAAAAALDRRGRTPRPAPAERLRHGKLGRQPPRLGRRRHGERGERAGGGRGQPADANPDSKWLAFASSGWVRYQLGTPAKAVRYALTSANDSPERDPRDCRSRARPTARRDRPRPAHRHRLLGTLRQRTFDVPTPGDDAYYRLNVTANQSGGIVQLAEFRLSDGSPAVPPSGPMVAEVGNGPTSAYNAKTGVGFTGLKALRYAGWSPARPAARPGTRSTTSTFPSARRPSSRTGSSRKLAKGDLRYPSARMPSVDLALHRRHLPVRPARRRPARLRDQPPRPGHVQGALRQPVEPAVGRCRRRRRRQDHRPDPRRLRQPGGGPADFGGWIDDLVVREAQPVVVGRPSDHVVTTRGTQSNGDFSRGNNFPTTAVPNGLQLLDPGDRRGLDVVAVRVPPRQQREEPPPHQGVLGQPRAEPLDGRPRHVPADAVDRLRHARRQPQRAALPFGHENEVARAHYYGVTFDNGLKAEIAPTDHAAAYAVHLPGRQREPRLRQRQQQRRAHRSTRRPARSAGSRTSQRRLRRARTRMFVYGTFDAPVTDGGTAAVAAAPSHPLRQASTPARQAR